MFACTPTIENSLGTPHTGLYRNRINRAIPGTGAALHAGIPVADSGLALLKRKNHVRADFQTTPAANTFVGIKDQCHYIFKISHHSVPLQYIPQDQNHRTNDDSNPAINQGMAIRVSFLTPDREV